MGNICRSPTAEAVTRKLLETEADDLEFEVDSAGTHAYHVGEPPDVRAQTAARRRGFDLSDLRARLLTDQDFERFDLLLVMDEQNRRDVLERAPARSAPRVRLLLEFAPEREEREIPDPYYGGSTGFEHVLDLVEEAAQGLLAELKKRAD
jgi:protein-tyrosine phosphatase